MPAAGCFQSSERAGLKTALQPGRVLEASRMLPKGRCPCCLRTAPRHSRGMSRVTVVTIVTVPYSMAESSQSSHHHIVTPYAPLLSVGSNCRSSCVGSHNGSHIRLSVSGSVHSAAWSGCWAVYLLPAWLPAPLRCPPMKDCPVSGMMRSLPAVHLPLPDGFPLRRLRRLDSLESTQ